MVSTRHVKFADASRGECISAPRNEIVTPALWKRGESPREALINAAIGSFCWLSERFSCQSRQPQRWAVHPVLTGEAEVAETSDSKGEPDEHAQECPSDPARSRANCTAGRERADAEGRRRSR